MIPNSELQKRRWPTWVLWVGFLLLPHLTIVGQIRQGGQIYYLVRYYDDLADDYAFCESDNNGFSGQCTNFALQDSDNADPQFYPDKDTGLLTVKFENSPSVWRIAVQPIHMYIEFSPNN